VRMAKVCFGWIVFMLTFYFISVALAELDGQVPDQPMRNTENQTVAMDFLQNLLPSVPDKARGLLDNQSISTNLSDAYPAAPYVQEAQILKNAASQPLDSLPLSSDGPRVLLPGYYWKETRTYCLKAGTYGPKAGGDGYLMAPLIGRDSELIARMMAQTELKNIPQHETQTLIWALKNNQIDFILKHPRTPDLLNEQDLLELQLKVKQQKATSALMSNLTGKVSGEISKLERQFGDTFKRFSNGSVSFAQLEKAAVLIGDPPPDKNDIDVPEGQWTQMPGGYYTRHFPKSYSSGITEYYMPEPVISKYDHINRPTLVMNERTGLRIDYEYYQDGAHVTFDDFPGVKAYPFKRLKVFFPAALNKGKDATLVFDNQGYILTGMLNKVLRQNRANSLSPGPVMVAMNSANDSQETMPLLAGASGSGTSRAAAWARDEAGKVVMDKAKSAGEEAAVGLADAFGGEDYAQAVNGAINIGNKVKGAMDMKEAYDKLSNRDLGSADKSRAARDVISGFGDSLPHLNIPLKMANAMIDEVTDIWNEVNKALSGGGEPCPKSSALAASPGKTHRQRLGKLCEF